MFKKAPLILFTFVLALGNILQIVSAPGQQIIRPQGSIVMQTMPQAVAANNASLSGTPQPAQSTPQPGDSSTVKMLLKCL